MFFCVCMYEYMYVCNGAKENFYFLITFFNHSSIFVKKIHFIFYNYYIKNIYLSVILQVFCHEPLYAYI